MTRVEYREEIKRRKQRARRRRAPVEAFLLIVLIAALTAIVALRSDTLAEKPEPMPAPTIRPPVKETPANIERTPESTVSRPVFFERVEKAEIVPVAFTVPAIDDAALEMLACTIYAEAGGDACSDLCRRMVADVVLNRVEDPRFPDTMEEVLTQEGQYGTWHWTGIQWPERASYPGEAAAVERAYNIARSVLEGEHSSIFGQGYIWGAEFSQGRDVVLIDGLYFGR